MNPIHPLAAMLPPMSDQEYADLKVSIEKNGLRRPVVMIGNEILAGHHRMRACIDLGISPTLRQYDPQKDGPLPVEFVLDEEINRRHMGTDQRAVFAAKLQAWKKDQAGDPDPKPENVVPIGSDDGPEVPPESTGQETGVEPGQEAGQTANEEDGVGKKGQNVTTEEQELMDRLKVGRDKLRQATRVQKGAPDLLESVAAGSIPLDEAEEMMNRRAGATKYRKEAADLLSADHGDETAERVRNCDLLYPDRDLKAFMALPLKEAKEVIETIAGTGWSARQAIQFLSAAFGGSDRLSDVFDWTAWELARTGKKRAILKTSGYKITVEKST